MSAADETVAELAAARKARDEAQEECMRLDRELAAAHEVAGRTEARVTAARRALLALAGNDSAP